MAELLIEIYNEEIPARMQQKAVEDFRNLFIKFFEKQNIKFSNNNVKSFISPRRLTLLALEIEETQILSATKKIGPKVGSPQKAIAGFAKSIGLEDITHLNQIETEKGLYYSYNQEEIKIDTAKIFEENLADIIQKMSSLWPKSMKWDNSSIHWVRPIRNILCIFNSKIINFEFGNLKSNNKSFTHLLLSNKSFEIDNFDQYQETLENNFVIFDHKKRKEIIISQIKEICKITNYQIIDNIDNNPLIDEACGLVEYPKALLGNIDKDFMSLPYEVLILTVKLHQKYFCLKDQKGNLAPKFIFITNIENNNEEKIIADNQKVLRARLSDAKFFIEEDLKTPLIKRLEGLKNIIFHEKLGSIYHKSKRLKALTKFISIWIPRSDISLVERLSDLSKTDLITKGVAELPELQGIIGQYYSELQNEDPQISKAIGEQYLPSGPKSPLPQTPLGITLSICDKIDSIAGLFLINEKPSSSKDPFALRRNALGIIRIITNFQISIPLRIIIEKAINTYPIKIIKSIYPDKKGKDIKLIKQKITFEIVEFFIERLKALLKDEYQVRSDIINEVFREYLSKIHHDKKCDLVAVSNKARFINQFVCNKSNLAIIELFKRANNIVNIEEKNDGKKYFGKPKLLSLRNQYDKNLYKKTKSINTKVKKAIKQNKLDEAFELLNELQQPLNKFFDNVTVNAKSANNRHNRLLILAKIRDLFNLIFDFSKIET